MPNAQKTNNLKNKLTYFILSILFGTISCGQRQILIPQEFVETNIPRAFSEEWRILNQSNNDYFVKNNDGKLEIEKMTKQNECEIKLPNGRIIGTNRGEFGGMLTFIPYDSTKKAIEIKKGNVIFIFTYEEKIYFIEGLAHMGYSGGAIFELNTYKSEYTYKKVLDFDDAPEAFTIYQDKFLVATHENFYVVQDFKKELIFEKTFWSGLYPTSIAVFDDNNIFVGIRNGIVKLSLKNKTLKFYKNDE